MFKLKQTKEPPDGRGRKAKYPFAKMKVGDMFESPIENYSKVARAAHLWGERNGVQMRIRKINDKTCGLWRIK